MMADVCEFEGCDKVAAASVRSVRGVERLCETHAFVVRDIEREWRRAEDEYLGGGS